jgi:hypothetical protein
MSNDELEAEVKKAVKAVLKNWDSYQYWPVKATSFGAKTVDCLACVPIKITKDMVGKTIGVFVAIETKRTKIKKPTKAQEAVMKQVQAAGGAAVLVHTTNDIQIENDLCVALNGEHPGAFVSLGNETC